MARLDVNEYRRMILKAVEGHIIANKDKVPHYSSQLLHEAIMSEMNRANPDTWEVEVPDNREQAVKEAEQRVMEFLKKNMDLGVGKSF